MSDSDDMPELVDSSDGEEVPKMATNFDYVDAWLIGRKTHLGEHHMCIRKCAYGPLLFGFSTNVPRMWISAMHDSKLLVKKNRETEVAALTKEEWELTDMFTEIFSHVNPKLKVRDHLKTSLDAIDEIEKQAIISNGVIDVKKAIEKAHEFRSFKILWTSMSGKTRMKKNPKAAKFCLLYVLKNFHYHVIGYGRDGKLVESEIKASWATVKSSDEAESSKEKGNKAFKENKFELAVRWYTQAIKKDPLNHIFYGNRSQAFLKLKKFREALCDGLRAVTLDHDWAKGYYRYAEAYFELGLLDKAREINHMGLQACQRTQDTLNLRQIEEQRAKFKTEKARLEQIEKNIWNTRGPPDLVSDSNDSEDEEDGAPQLISDSDDNCPPVKSTLLRRKQELRKQVLVPFTQTLREGSDAVDKGYSEKAMTAFKKALDECSSNKFLQKTFIEADVVVLKYAFGISSVMAGSFSNIMDGISKFKEITSFHPNVKFPAIYYGLGKAYITLNRYEEAHKPVSSGLAVVKNGLKCTVHNWPGTDKPIPETRKDKLESLLRELMEVCKYPPTPDAVCRHRGCQEKDRKSIYFSDPDFKGFVRVNCKSMCVIEFHPTCWKAFKNSRTEKASDKEQIDKACPTPDCSSCIHRICVYRNEGTEPKIYSSESVPKSNKSVQKSNKSQKKSQKSEPSSQEKISRKAEKKAIRKQKRQEARDAKEEEEKEEEKKEEEEKQETVAARGVSLASQVLQDEQELEALAKAETMLYKKEETEESPLYKTKPKTTKQKKKKEKTKQVLNVEVNFTDRRDDQLLGEHSLADEEDMKPAVAVNMENPFSVPRSLQQQVRDFDSVYDHGINPQNNQHNEVANNLYVYFAELLGEHGPLHVSDVILTKELEDFPPEAREVIDMYGSLKGFLQQSLKFGLIDDFVCLLKDAVKAKKLAEAYRVEYPHLKPAPFSAAVQGRAMQRPVNKNVPPSVINMCPDVTKPPPNMIAMEKRPIVNHSLDKHSVVTPVVDKSPLNPSALEFKPQPSAGYGKCVEDSFVKPACENAVEIDHLVRSSAKSSKFKMTGYNDLDDFSIPSFENVPQSQDGKTLLENMDDIDDIQLCDDELVSYAETTNKLDWSEEKWGDDVDSLPETNTFSQNGYSVFGPRSIAVKPDDLDPSRCSSRSSHSELGEIELGYQTRSPAIQGLKSAYSKKDIQKDVLSPSSFSNSDIFQGSPVLCELSQRKSPIIPPHPMMTSASPYNSRPSSCGSPMAAVVSSSGDGPSISNIWAPDSTSSFPSTSIFTKPAADSNSFFQDPLSKPSQNAFSGLPSTTQWSSTDGLENQETASSSYTLFGGLPGSGFGQKNEWSNVKTSVNTSVQVSVETVTKGTSTDFDLTNLLAHYKAMQDQHAQMITTLHKAEEEKLALTTTVKQYQLDTMKREQQHKALLAQISQYQHQLSSLQHLNTSLEECVQQKDHQLDELQAKQAVNSEQSAREMSETQTTLTQLQTQYKNQVNRAVSAEQDFLNLKLQTTLQPYSGAKREATFHQHHVSTFVRKCQEEKKELPAKTKQILSHLASVLESCNARIAEIQAQYERNAQQLSEGVPLCDLPPLSVASPPVPMPAEIAALMSQIFGSGSSRVPLRLSPTESAPKMLLAPVTPSLPPNPPKPLGPPKPLQPLSLMSLAKTPMTTSQLETGLQNGQSKLVVSAPAKSSFEKLITAVKKIFPSYERSEVVKLVHQLRESRGGSLSGISLEDILRNITDMVLQKDSPGLLESSPAQTYNPAPPPGLASSWGFSAPTSTRQTREVYVDELNPCAICHEELELKESRGLDCGHRFHTECIRTWFKEQSTCPNCRVHALLADDFPSLK